MSSATFTNQTDGPAALSPEQRRLFDDLMSQLPTQSTSVQTPSVSDRVKSYLAEPELSKPCLEELPLLRKPQPPSLGSRRSSVLTVENATAASTNDTKDSERGHGEGRQ